MSSGGYGYGDSASKRRRGHSRSRSPVESRRPKGEKKAKKDKKNQQRLEQEEASRRKQHRARSRSRDGGTERGGGADRGDRGEKGDRRDRGDRGDRGNRGDRGDRDRGDRGGGKAQAEAPQVAPAPQEEAVLGRTHSRTSVPGVDAPQRQPSKWRQELAETEGDGNVGKADESDGAEDDEAAVEKALNESRARREALIAKWVNRGEGGQNGAIDLDTPLDGAESETDGEASGGEEATAATKAETGEPDEEKLKQNKDLMRFILQNKAEHDDDMFDENADEDALKGARNSSAAISQTGASADDWDDTEGYYKAKIGEVMAGRYLVVEDTCGKGVFSNVVKAKDQETNMQVAIKVMRCNDMMRQAAEKEVEVLERLNKADRGNKKHVIRLIRHFFYRGHMCLVFECMWDNLRVALKKYTKDKGMSLQAVRAYTKQLLIALRHVHRCDIIHCDIKPDNILISAGHNVVKICDLGSGMNLIEVETTPYLVSRFYRAPEIVLGAKYGVQLDTFAMGATLVELFTGKILFPGRTNNDMLRLFMEVKGKIPHKVIKSGQLWKNHFDENLDFKYFDTNKATKKKITRMITDFTQKRQIVDMVLNRCGAEKQKSTAPEDQLYIKKAKQFADLIEKMTAMDPERRITPHDALQHPFVKDAFALGGGAKDGKQGGGQKK